MRVLGHTALSISLGGILYTYSHSVTGFLSFLIAGIFIDADHYIDYVREKSITFNLKKINGTFRYGYMHFKKLTLFLHSYELIFAAWLAIFIFHLDLVWIYAAISFTLHILIDQASNPVFPLAYFLSYRIAVKFDTKKIFLNDRIFIKGVNHARRRR